MTRILNIETSTTVCSVSLTADGANVADKELNAGFTHAENLHLFIAEVVKTSSIELKQVDAIAVSCGPGSYTGLRIGVSAAKGLAYALNIPLISVDTLQIMAYGARRNTKNPSLYCPMIDARRMEVYTAVYDTDLLLHLPIESFIVNAESVQRYRDYPEILFFGDGMPKCADILKDLPNAVCIDGIVPSAKYMCELSYRKFLEKKFENVAYFEPYYLKDFLVKTKL